MRQEKIKNKKIKKMCTPHHGTIAEASPRNANQRLCVRFTVQNQNCVRIECGCARTSSLCHCKSQDCRSESECQGACVDLRWLGR